MGFVKTVGELKEILKDLDDNTLLLVYKTGMEKTGNMPEVYVEVSDFVKKKINTWDRFDGESYSYICYDEPDKNNKKETETCVSFR